MAEGGSNDRRFGLYVALGQTGVEMVVPLVIGVLLDRAMGWTPWGLVVGAVVGFAGGLAHMIVLANRLNNDKDKPGPRRGNV